ncbi:uncharacterized protein LOC127805785 [Diospyros lotus]|uniref:uncharacterized protein LOC127805785 n=1 Tax=Diospyros lotus TaxID=55363 RepID=UPI002252669B|nr:uncharacterized protein LOC127805785 [Diospyros lotus]
MIKRQSLRSSLLSFFLLPHHRPRHSLQAGFSLMAGLFRVTNDPSLSMLSSPSPFDNTLHARALHSHHHAAALRNLFLIDRTGGARVMLRGLNGRCVLSSTTNRPNLYGCCSRDATSSDAHNSAFQKNLPTFASTLPMLLHDSEIALQEDVCNAPAAPASARFANGRGGALDVPDQRYPEKIAVAVDVDEVLGNFVSALNRFIADRYSSNHSISEYNVYEFFKIWNCSREEADFRVHEFFKTPYFKTGIHPIPGAQRALQKLSRFCNLSVVTSRQNVIRDHTIAWIEKHFPGLFQEIHFGNHFALEGQSRPKSEICRSLGAKVLIDDNPRYAMECAKVGIKVLLFDYEHSYPWCKIESINQHPMITRVHSWEEVERQLVSWVIKFNF